MINLVTEVVLDLKNSMVKEKMMLVAPDKRIIYPISTQVKMVRRLVSLLPAQWSLLVVSPVSLQTYMNIECCQMRVNT